MDGGTIVSLTARAFRRFLHQYPQLGMRGLEGGMQVELFQGLGGGGADGTDQAVAQRRQRCVLDSLLSRHLRQMTDLDRGGKQRRLKFAGRQAAGRFPQGFRILRQPISVDAHRGYLGAAGAQRGYQFRIAPPILLHCDAALVPAFDGAQEFVPGIGLGSYGGRRHAQFAQRRYRLGTACHHGDFAQRIGEGSLSIPRRQKAIELARAHTGQQDHHFEFAGEQAIGKAEDVRMILDGNFTHGRRHERLAAMPANQFCHLRGPAALQCQDMHSIKGHSRFYNAEMKLLFSFVCFAALIQAQTPTDSQLLLNEVRQLRQDLAATTMTVQRTQILLFRLQLEEAAMTRATQRLDQAKSQLTSAQQRRKDMASQTQSMEEELNRTQDATQKARIPQIIANLRGQIETWTAQEQDAQSKVIDAEMQLRTEQAKHDALDAALDKLDKQLEAAGR